MKNEDTRKVCKSIAKAMVNGLNDGDLFFMDNLFEARQIFVPVCSNRLFVAMAMLYAVFTNIHQKFDQRRMDIIYEV